MSLLPLAPPLSPSHRPPLPPHVQFPEGMKGLGDWITSQETFPGLLRTAALVRMVL